MDAGRQVAQASASPRYRTASPASVRFPEMPDGKSGKRPLPRDAGRQVWQASASLRCRTASRGSVRFPEMPDGKSRKRPLPRDAGRQVAEASASLRCRTASLASADVQIFLDMIQKNLDIRVTQRVR